MGPGTGPVSGTPNGAAPGPATCAGATSARTMKQISHRKNVNTDAEIVGNKLSYAEPKSGKLKPGIGLLLEA